MEQIGYSLITADGAEVLYWGDLAGQSPTVPEVITLPNGDRVHCPAINQNYQGLKIVPRMLQIGDAVGISYNGTQTVVTRAPPVPGTLPPRLIASALSIEIANQDVSNIAGAFNLVGAIYLDVGQYMLLFLSPEADANYFAVVTGSASNFSISEQTEDYVIVQATNNGTPFDPSSLSVQIFRMES